MAYYTGESLRNRVRQTGLSPLYDLLRQVAAGTAEWPQPSCTITLTRPEDAEPIRTLLYSVLNELGLKPRFRVSATAGQVVLTERAPRQLGVQFGPAPNKPESGQTDQPDQETLDVGAVLQEDLLGDPELWNEDQPGQSDQPLNQPLNQPPKETLQ